MTSYTNDQIIEIYYKDVHMRIYFLDKVFNNQITFSKTVCYDIIMTQFRKILEDIAFVSVVNHKEDLGTDINSSGFENWWKAKDIIERIERINPMFYPRPSIFSPEQGEDGITDLLFDQRDHLTKPNFIELYNIAGKYLHQVRPLEKKAFDLNQEEVLKYYWKLVDLMKQHILFLSNGDYYLIQVLPCDHFEKVRINKYRHIGGDRFTRRI